MILFNNENIKDIELKTLKWKNSIIYRNNKKVNNMNDLALFRKNCKLKAIKFYVANNYTLAILLNSDGLYLSSFNKRLKSLNYIKSNFEIIGSAHNYKEIYEKLKQGCSSILFSKLFVVDYDKKASYLGVVKFNNLSRISRNLIPLGGIKIKNLNKLKNVYCEGFALLSEIKKKPAKIISRLF